MILFPLRSYHAFFTLPVLQLLLLPLRLSMKQPLNPLRPTQEKPTRKENKREIKNAETNKNAEIPPLIRIKHIKASCKLITVPMLTEFTNAFRTSLYITSSLGDELFRVRVTVCAWRWVETCEFLVGALDRTVMDGGREEPLEEVGERGEVVHPGAPKGGETSEGNDDPTE